jgi:repressor LexA
MQGLTKRQEQTLDFIRLSIGERGYPPTLREIGEHMGIRSTNGVNDHLVALERKGYVKREDLKSRTLRIVDSEPPIARSIENADLIEIKVLGRILAGLPLLADEHVVDVLQVDRAMVKGSGQVFALKVAGDSMIQAHVMSGDYVIARKQATAERGDMVVALIGDEALVRRFYPERDYVRFQPDNSSMPPVLVRASDFRSSMILGKVVSVWRRFA